MQEIEETESKWQSPICFGRPHGGAGVDVCSESECIDCPVNSLFKIKSFMSAVCLHWDWQFQTSSSSLSLLHLPLHSFFFLSFQLFSSFEPSSKDSCGAPSVQKASLLQSQQEAKPVHSAAMPPGPVAFLCLVSCPVPFIEVDERTRFTKKQKQNKNNSKELLFLEQDGVWFNCIS